jgi:hypothetical protein
MKREIAYTWSSTLEECQMRFPCARYELDSDDVYFRAINGTSARILFRWLCQLKMAPHSYDWITNLERMFFGKKESYWTESPKELAPGIEKLASNQKITSFFNINDFEQNRSLTSAMDSQQAISTFGY